ncbi:MAG: sugar phosphate isomerase/epimerase [Elusimicrobia bacterium]|nr:sugar phosphate isomerase/epimerase [Elusimicrobiota bacterium]
MYKVLPDAIFSEGTGLREKLRIAKVGEFNGININMEEVHTLVKDHSPAYVKGMLDSFNLKVGIWNLPFSLTADQKVYEKGLELLKEYSQTASYVEAFRVITYVDSKELKGDTNLYVKRINAVTEILSQYGCSIGIGIKHGRHFISPDIIKIFKKIKSGNLGFIFSARLWHLSGGEAGELRRIPNGEIIYVMVGDISFEGKGKYLPGETGTINLPLFLNTLEEIGYDGPVVPEIPDREILTIPHEITARLLGGALMKVWNKTFIER